MGERGILLEPRLWLWPFGIVLWFLGGVLWTLTWPLARLHLWLDRMAQEAEAKGVQGEEE